MNYDLIEDLAQLKQNICDGVYWSEIQDEIRSMLTSFLRPQTIKYDPIMTRYLVLGWAVDQYLDHGSRDDDDDADKNEMGG